MIKAAKCEHNKSKFIVSRIFDRPFKVTSIDLTATKYYARLDDLSYQLRKVANNYNQTVRAVHQNFNEETTRKLLYRLEMETIELRKLEQRIIELTDDFREQYWRK